jgi:hypothetical protein
MTFFLPLSFLLLYIPLNLALIVSGSFLASHYFSFGTSVWIAKTASFFPLWQHILLFVAAYIWSMVWSYFIVGFVIYGWRINSNTVTYFLLAIGILAAPLTLLLWMILWLVIMIIAAVSR